MLDENGEFVPSSARDSYFEQKEREDRIDELLRELHAEKRNKESNGEAIKKRWFFWPR